MTKVGYVGNKRYLKLLADFSGTHGIGTPIAATVIKGNAHERPSPDDGGLSDEGRVAPGKPAGAPFHLLKAQEAMS